MRWRSVRAQRSVDRGRMGGAIEPRNLKLVQGADVLSYSGRQHCGRRYRRVAGGPCAVEEPRHVRRAPCARTGRSRGRPWVLMMPRPGWFAGWQIDAKQSRKNYCGSWYGVDGVIPVRVELVADDVHRSELRIRDFDAFGVLAGVQTRVDLQSGAGGGRADQVDDHLQALQRLAAPVQADVREHTVLDFVPFAGARREMTDADRDQQSVGELWELGLPQAGAAGVAPAAISGDRQARRVGVARTAEVRPPRPDRIDRERARVVGDPDRHHALVGLHVEHAEWDRVPEILVLEIVGADLHRPARRLVLPPDSLEIAYQFSLFAVHADHRLARLKRRPSDLVDIPKLRVAIRMILALTRLLVGVQPIAEALEQLPDRPITNLVPGRRQRPRELLQALRGPPQRRHRIPTRIRIHQPLKIPQQRRIGHRQPRTPRPPTTDLPRLQPHTLPQLLDPTLHRVLRDPRRTRNRSNPATPTRPSLTRRPNPPLTLVQLRTQPSKTLRNLRFIDHAPAIRHPPPNTLPNRTNSFLTTYSMRQAIEEGFIMDVLANYTT